MTAILGLQGFFPLRGKAALGVGGMDSPVSDRKRLAALYVNQSTFKWSLNSPPFTPQIQELGLSSLPKVEPRVSARPYPGNLKP